MTKQLSFVDAKIASIIPPDDPLKILFQPIHFSFIYELTKDKSTDKGKKAMTRFASSKPSF